MASGVILAVRAAIGPFRMPLGNIVVNSPFRLETIFWFCVLALDPFRSDDYILLSSVPFRWTNFVAHLRAPGGDGAWRPLGYA